MRKRILGFSALLAVALALAGCANNGRVRQASSMPLDKVIENAKDSRVTADKSPLTFPASVAVLMVPASGGVPQTDLHQAAETLKKKLLENRKYIGAVSIVSTFDVSKKTTLEQVGASYAADVVILVFYQQYQRTVQSGPAALLDIAIVPAFTVPGVKVNTATLIEGVVAHIPSNAVIFRTSAYDERSAYSTSYSEANTAASTSVESFDAAMVNFGNDLSETLDRFDRFDVSKAPSMNALTESAGEAGAGGSAASNDYWKKVDSFKSGGGAFDPVILLLFGAAWAIARRRIR
jgi:rhombotail lipoprotein